MLMRSGQLLTLDFLCRRAFLRKAAVIAHLLDRIGDAFRHRAVDEDHAASGTSYRSAASTSSRLIPKS